MNLPSVPILREALGTIVGWSRALLVVVRPDDGGAEISCRGFKRLHRRFGFMRIPVGRRVRIRFDDARPLRPPLILDVLPVQPPPSSPPADAPTSSL
jgi:hypothetical protein